MQERSKNQIIVTGGAGFIGSEVVRQLADGGHEVAVIDNLVNGKKENLDGMLSDRVVLHEVDIRDDQALQSVLKGAHAVYHLACLGVRHSIHSPRENHEVNATGTLQLLALAKEAGVERFVHVSSSEIYGTARFVPITEDCPPFPHTVYGASKLAGECYSRAYWDTYRFPTVVVRPFNSFGPRCHHEGDSGEVIPKFLLRAMAGLPLVVFGDGEQTRDFTQVEDTARAILQAGAADAVIGETINVGCGEEITINRLAGEVAAVVGQDDVQVDHIEARPGDVRRLISDTAKAKELLNYSPSIGLREGLEKLKAWYADQETAPQQLMEEEQGNECAFQVDFAPQASK